MYHQNDVPAHKVKKQPAYSPDLASFDFRLCLYYPAKKYVKQKVFSVSLVAKFQRWVCTTHPNNIFYMTSWKQPLAEKKFEQVRKFGAIFADNPYVVIIMNGEVLFRWICKTSTIGWQRIHESDTNDLSIVQKQQCGTKFINY